MLFLGFVARKKPFNGSDIKVTRHAELFIERENVVKVQKKHTSHVAQVGSNAEGWNILDVDGIQLFKHPAPLSPFHLRFFSHFPALNFVELACVRSQLINSKLRPRSSFSSYALVTRSARFAERFNGFWNCRALHRPLLPRTGWTEKFKSQSQKFSFSFSALYSTRREGKTFPRDHGSLEKWQKSFLII